MRGLGVDRDSSPSIGPESSYSGTQKNSILLMTKQKKASPPASPLPVHTPCRPHQVIFPCFIHVITYGSPVHRLAPRIHPNLLGFLPRTVPGIPTFPALITLHCLRPMTLTSHAPAPVDILSNPLSRLGPWGLQDLSSTLLPPLHTLSLHPSFCLDRGLPTDEGPLPL